jgi:anthranilate synthase/aminodeoxychorismate synthase-like glutamine amidotransferase
VIVLIDNYDSFVYNLARYLAEMRCATEVIRNDRVSVAELSAMKPAAILLSPGPCTPTEAGISLEVVRQLRGRVPILGVCLGHQAIAAAFGAEIVRAPEPVHGRTSLIEHRGQGLFAGIPNPFTAARYHSLIVREATLPEELIVTARTPDGMVMAIEHRSEPLFGVQFHPESVLTESGHRLLANFLHLAGVAVGSLPPGDLVDPLDDPESPGEHGRTNSRSPAAQPLTF